MKSQGRENSWPDPNLPDKKKVRDALFYKEFVCTEGAKSFLMTNRRKKSEVKHTWLAHASSTEDRQLHFCTLGHAGRKAVVANSLSHHKWSRRTVPSSCLQLHRVIVTSMQSLGKNTTRMELQGARLSLSPAHPVPFFFLLNNHDNWCCVSALNTAVTPLTRLALFVQNPPSAFWLLLFASHWHCTIAKGT